VRTLNIGIIGCGTAGLAATIFLGRQGHNLTLFEKFSSPLPLGAGLLLQPTGLEVLRRLNLLEDALRLGARIDHLYGKTSDGRPIFDIRYSELSPHIHGLGIQRGTLFSLLYSEVKRQNYPLYGDTAIQRVDQDSFGAWAITHENQRHGPFDLIIDASGLRSLIRETQALNSRHTPYPWGAVWGLCDDPDSQFTEALRQVYQGPQIMIGALPVGRSSIEEGQDTLPKVAFFWSMKADLLSTFIKDDLSNWKSHVIRLWPDIQPLVSQFGKTAQLFPVTYGDVRMKSWNQGRLIFIGDSAHATSPQLGQGANLALLDAAILSDCLAFAKDIDAALMNYHHHRRHHLCFYQMASRWLTPFFQSDLSWLGKIRDWSFTPMGRIPFMRRQMLQTLAGLKTGSITWETAENLAYHLKLEKD